MNTTRGGLGGIVVALCLVGSAIAQCTTAWRGGPEIPIPESPFEPDTEIQSLLEWDPDGENPDLPVLLAGSSKGIFFWDGSGWGNVGSPGSSAVIRTLGVFKGVLYIGGTFVRNTGGISNFAFWNPLTKNWDSVGSGISGAGGVAVRAMAEYKNKLFVTGKFTNAGPLFVDGLACWTGTVWSPLPPGGTSGNALATYADDLYVGGVGSSGQVLVLHRFNGNSWSTTPTGLTGSVLSPDGIPTINSLTVFGDRLIVAGDFRNAGSVQNCNGIAAWNGATNTWEALGTGMNAGVRAVATVDGQLVAAGDFSTAGGVPAARVAVWDGVSWTGLVQSIGGPVDSRVSSLGSFNGELVAGGTFGSVNGMAARFAARFNGRQWLPLAVTTPVRAFAPGVVACGDFAVLLDGPDAFRCARWNGKTLSALADLTTNSGPFLGAFHAALRRSVLDDSVYLGGIWGSDGTPLSGSQSVSWSSTKWEKIGQSIGGRVYALAIYKEKLFAGGSFVSLPGKTFDGIAQLENGSWEPVGSGLGGTVYSLYAHGDVLYAGGTFTGTSGSAAKFVAAWDGSAWSVPTEPLVAGSAPRPVGVFAIDAVEVEGRTRLVIGGSFANQAGDVENLAFFEPSDPVLKPLGGKVTGVVRALAKHEGRLYVGGDIRAVPSGPARNIASWDPTDGWRSLGAGVDSTVFALQSAFQTELHVGGAFTAADGFFTPHWAIYNPTGRPAISLEPSNQVIEECKARFAVEVPDAYGAVSYQWLFDGSPLADGQAPSGSVVAGATTRTLSLSNLGPADLGGYSCRVSNACGITVSAQATLAACAADVNADCFVDASDYDLFLLDWMEGGSTADTNGDGFVDAIDLDLFISHFVAGC